MGDFSSLRVSNSCPLSFNFSLLCPNSLTTYLWVIFQASEWAAVHGPKQCCFMPYLPLEKNWCLPMIRTRKDLSGNEPHHLRTLQKLILYPFNSKFLKLRLHSTILLKLLIISLLKNTLILISPIKFFKPTNHQIHMPSSLSLMFLFSLLKFLVVVALLWFGRYPYSFDFMFFQFQFPFPNRLDK